MNVVNRDNNRFLGRLFNAIRESLEEMDSCPDDSVQDIWNEKLEAWETGLSMNKDYNIEPSE
jgi:hypothetical protein